MKKGMTQVFVTVIIALIVVSIVGVWTATKARDLLNDVNNTVPRIDYSRQEFRELEQVYSGSTSMFFRGWKTSVPEGKDACFQPLPQFGDFFRYYDMNLVVTSGDNNIKTVYFRVADTDNNRVATNSFDTEKSLCIIDYSTGQDIKSAPKITFSSLTLTKNINLLQRDKFLVKIPEKDYEKEFGTSSLEYFPLMYIDKTNTCFVIGAQNGINSFGSVLPICDSFSLEEVADMVSADLNSCLESQDDNCGCKINVPSVEGLAFEVNNFAEKMNITFANQTDKVTRSYEFMLNLGNDKTESKKVGEKEIETPRGTFTSPDYEVTTYSYFPENINYFNKEITAEYSIEIDFEPKQTVTNEIYLYKPINLENFQREQILGETKVTSAWKYLSIINDLNRVELCK